MKHCVKKLLSLAFALALCLAVGGIALAETPEQEVLDYEPNVTTAADVPNTTGNLERDGYTVTIPTTVEVKSGENKGTLEVKAQLKQYRTLNIGIASNNKWKLAYDDTTAADTPQVAYTLTTEDREDGKAIAHYENNTLHYGTGELDSTDPKYDSTTGARKFTTNFSVNVKDPSQATMSGTYSDTLTFTFNITKQSVTYTINVYEQKLQLTNSGAHVQAVNVVDASGNVTDTTSMPKETYVLEYGCADANGTPLGNAVTTDTWMRPRPANDNGEDARCWEDLSRTLTPKADFTENVKAQTINLNLVRKWYWLDVNGATDYANEYATGNQGNKIAGFVDMQVSADNGTTWSDWFWYKDGDDYWGQFPYGIRFKLGFHHVKNGYVYDTGTGTLENGFRIIANKVDTRTTYSELSSDKKTTYYVYEGTLTGTWTDTVEGSKNRYCYIPCYKKGITYFANGGGGGTESVNTGNPPRSNVPYQDGDTLKSPAALLITPPSDDMVFAGWSTKRNYTTGDTLYKVGEIVEPSAWETYTDPTDLNKRPELNGVQDTQKRELYAIWKKPYTVKVQFGGVIGWTTWDAANQSFPENKQDGDGFDTAVELGTAYAYGNTSLTLSETENKTVWTALKAKITEKTKDIAGTTPPEDVWQLKDEYTFTTLPANGEVTIQIKRKRYLLNVIPALQNDDGTFTVADNIETAKQYGKFDLDSCGKPQTLEGKISYYQWMRNYGGSYHIYNVKANTGYQFLNLMRMTSSGLTSTDDRGTLTGKNSGIHYFGDTSGNTYTGDTIYVMFKEDNTNKITLNANTGTGENTKMVTYGATAMLPTAATCGFTNGKLKLAGWSTKKTLTGTVEEGVDYFPAGTEMGNITGLKAGDTLYAQWGYEYTIKYESEDSWYAVSQIDKNNGLEGRQSVFDETKTKKKVLILDMDNKIENGEYNASEPYQWMDGKSRVFKSIESDKNGDLTLYFRRNMIAFQLSYVEAGEGLQVDSTHHAMSFGGKYVPTVKINNKLVNLEGRTTFYRAYPYGVAFEFKFADGTSVDGKKWEPVGYTLGLTTPQGTYTKFNDKKTLSKTLQFQGTTPIFNKDGVVCTDDGTSIRKCNVWVVVKEKTTGPNRAPAKKALTVRYHANFDPMEELALDLDPNPLLEDMDEDFGFDPDPLPEDILDPTVEAVKIVTYKPDENVVLRNCMFKRGGYVFVGWNTEPDGTGRNYEVNGVPITDWAAGATVDLYAQWKKPDHLKPVVDGEPQPGGTAPAPTPQPGGAAPAPQPGGADDAFGIDPQRGGMDDAFGIDPQQGGMDDAFGVDPQSEGLDDAFGV